MTQAISAYQPRFIADPGYDRFVLSLAPDYYWPMIEMDGVAVNNLSAIAGAGSYNGQSGGVWTGGTFGQNRFIAADAGLSPTFNGTSGYCNVGTLGSLGSNLSAGLSLSCWLRSGKTTAHHVIGTRDGSLHNFLLIAVNANNVNGRILALLADDDGTTVNKQGESSISDGANHHLFISILPGTNAVVIMVDGSALSLTTNNAASPSNFINLPYSAYLGATNNAGTTIQFFNGDIGRFALWNSIIDPAVAYTLYKRGAA